MLRTLSIAVVLFIIPSLAFAQQAVRPLSAEHARLVAAVPDEQTPVPEDHYIGSNEWRHDLFFNAIRDLGGGFVGVASDQCYTLAAVQNASFVWLVDYDAVIPKIHRLYGTLIKVSETPDQFRAHFDSRNFRATIALLEENLANDPARDEIVRTYRRYRGAFPFYLRHVARLERDGHPTSWLADPVLYGRIRALYLAGRVVARNADVTGPNTMRAIGEAMHRMRITVRVVYFSNAEFFFPFSEQFQQNVRGFPTDDRTVVLRTFRQPGAVVYPENDTWAYMVHPMPDYYQRLSLGYRRQRMMVWDALRAGHGGRNTRDGAIMMGPNIPALFSRQ